MQCSEGKGPKNSAARRTVQGKESGKVEKMVGDQVV